MTTELMPPWVIDRYSEAVRRATTNARKPWRDSNLFTWDEVNSFAWEIATQRWKEWEAPHIRNPEGYANRDLTLRAMNALEKEARRLGWSKKNQPDGSRKWVAPPKAIVPDWADLADYFPTPAADAWVGTKPLSREELKEHLLVLARNYQYINTEAERLSEPVWEQFSTWIERYERQRAISFAKRTAEMALARYAYEVLRDEMPLRNAA